MPRYYQKRAIGSSIPLPRVSTLGFEEKCLADLFQLMPGFIKKSHRLEHPWPSISTLVFNEKCLTNLFQPMPGFYQKEPSARTSLAQGFNPGL
ncbi:hypothetical protein [Dyadobacter chenhuakuii]|uniref:hypothetical protein n=1 Tax=Dyadobacter chenhuakuii TaxID=2909339 RepID=UPI001F462E39|nr:hypothetical protein [Dyadobacter chenhuakuii]